ncbi:reverse transcriptase domain-containing protein [Tanacetum coccineum]
MLPWCPTPSLYILDLHNSFHSLNTSYSSSYTCLDQIIYELLLVIENMEDKIEGLANGRDFYSRNDHRGYPGLLTRRYEESSGQDQITMVLLPSSFLKPLYPDIMDMIIDQDIEHTISPSPDYPLMNYLSGRTEKMAPKRTSTSAAPTMTQAAIKKLVADSVSAALEAQVATMANNDNTNRNTGQRETPVVRKCSYKEFMSYEPFNFKGKFATGTLTEEALSWWNLFAQPIGIEEAYKIAWSEFKTILIKKYCPRTEIKKMEDEFYNLTVKGNDLKTYFRRFQELAVLCPTIVPNSDKLMEVFIGGLPRSIEGNVTA